MAFCAQNYLQNVKLAQEKKVLSNVFREFFYVPMLNNGEVVWSSQMWSTVTPVINLGFLFLPNMKYYFFVKCCVESVFSYIKFICLKDTKKT